MNPSLALAQLPASLVNETGMPGLGTAFSRGRGEGDVYWRGMVGDFLAQPENQHGQWLIDGGWGGPPGAIRVTWVVDHWTYDGFPPYRAVAR